MYQKGTLLTHRIRWIAPLIIVVIVLGAFTSIGLAQPDRLGDGAIVTPYQQAIQEMFGSRAAQGLNAPSIRTSASVNVSERVQNGLTIVTESATATTIIQADNPQQLGLDAWPPLTAGVETAEGEIVEINVDNELRASMAAQDPDYDYDQGARTFIHVETISRERGGTAFEDGGRAPLAVSTEDILMGFTMHMGFSITISDGVEIGDCDFPIGTCVAANFSLGVGLGFDAGLRLPASLELEGPDLVEVGTDYFVDATLTGEDWNAGQYTAKGVPAQGGNEFIIGGSVNWSVGVNFTGCLVNICGGDGGSIGDDHSFGVSENFATPLGPGAFFPIAVPPIPLVGFNFLILEASINLQVTPQIGSDKITADWEAVPGTNCNGSGTVEFNQSGVAAQVGPITACDNGNPSNQATIELTNFRYWFTIFQIDFDIVFTMRAEAFDFEFFEFNVTLFDFTLDASTFITGLVDPYIEDHFGCDFSFNITFPPLNTSTGEGCNQLENSATFTTTTQDTTAPVTTLHASGLIPGNNGWWRSSPVTVNLTADDAEGCGSGIDFIEYRLNDDVGWTLFTGPFQITHEGTTLVHFRATDNDGNLEVFQTEAIMIDLTPPVIEGSTIPLPNANGWWNTNVTVHFDAFDPDPPGDFGSGLFFVTPDVVVSTEGAGQFVDGMAEDLAGWQSFDTVTDINIDKTPPELTIHSPEPITYANTDPLIADWTASDALSGIFSEEGLLDGITPYNDGDPIDLLLVGAGPHVFSVEVVDLADNVTYDEVEFFVTVDIDGLIASVEHMCSLGLVDNPGICNSLLAKLQNAKRKIDACQLHVAMNMLEAFINQVNAQNGKHIDGAAAGVLAVSAQYVIDNLPACEEEVVEEEAPVEVPQPGNGQGNGPGNNPGQGNGPGDNPGQGNGPADNPGQGNGPADNPGQGNGPGDNPGQGNGPDNNNGKGN